MFDLFRSGPPADWEPLPDDVREEIGPWEFPDEDPVEPGAAAQRSVDEDYLIGEALSRELGVDTIPLIDGTPIAVMSPRSQSLVLRRLDEFSTYVEARKAEVTAAIAGPRPTTAGDRLEDYSGPEVSLATKCSVYAADARIAFARDLADRLSATAEAMRCGRISYQQAMLLSQATCHLDVRIAREIEERMLRFAYRQDRTRFSIALNGWVARLDPDFTEKAATARKECEVNHTANHDGTGSLYIRGPLEITTALSMALTAWAAKTKDSLGGTAAQRKLAGLRQMAEESLASPDTPRRHGRLPVVNVVVDLFSLFGLRNQPAQIPGVGFIPASVARWLLADGAPLRRFVIDPLTGHLLDYGKTTYKVPADLAEFLIALNVMSASPHSNVDAALADMEHNPAYGDGGTTDRKHCTPVDRRWHRAKTHADWTYVKHDDGVVVWTSPTGLSCQIDPYDYRAGP
jgi:hypothetical protein